MARSYNLFWPVPDSYSKKPPPPGDPGGFWENRGDRHHCGVDIYAPFGSEVRAVESGVVVNISVFTSPEIIPYWNKTFAVTVRSSFNYYFKYAEMNDVVVHQDQKLRAGQLVGHVGKVLNPSQIDDSSPDYIRRLNEQSQQSMLHFEVYRTNPSISHYCGGNYFSDGQPEHLMDPTPFLNHSSEESCFEYEYHTPQ